MRQLALTWLYKQFPFDLRGVCGVPPAHIKRHCTGQMAYAVFPQSDGWYDRRLPLGHPGGCFSGLLAGTGSFHLADGADVYQWSALFQKHGTQLC